MDNIVCYDYSGTTLNNLYQWDSNIRILISGIDAASSIEVHFCHYDSSEALVLIPNIDGANIVSTIPNILLQRAKPLIVYVFQDSEESGARTINTLYIPVYPRPKPADYIYTETEVLCYREIDERIKVLESGGTASGYYTPKVTKPRENTLQFNFIASNENMPTVDPVVVTLSSSSDSSLNGDASDFCVIDATNGWSSMDMTYAEIQAAYDTGKILVLYNAGYQFDLVSADNGFVFERHYVEGTKLVTDRCSLDDGMIFHVPRAVVLDVLTDDHINELIDTALGVIENGTY